MACNLRILLVVIVDESQRGEKMTTSAAYADSLTSQIVESKRRYGHADAYLLTYLRLISAVN
ncbi:hypothetical protein MUK42_35979 [Musa troglodytarum]|uniref:Uncharacterized protein n=1 Tax=Musa troglodytarum TaxID=320322 RepID=A0A9E7JCH6_9LILI|nr:hypothetical protein MUK42_35979 [Musa troglodytarum]